MKNKIFYLFLCVLLLNFKALSSEKFTYEANEIEILDNGNFIKSTKGVKIILNENIEIIADKFEYNKKKNLVKLNGNINVNDEINKLNIEANEVFYLITKNKIFSKTFSKFKFDNKYIGESDGFNYFIDNARITSDNKMTVRDLLGNSFFIDSFKYEIEKGIFSGSNTKYIDKEKNTYFISDTLINLKNNHVLGKDLNIKFNKSSFGNSENDPRLKSRSFRLVENITSMNKGVFTTCKKNDKCPPWKIYAENIQHDKEKETISYKNAWLKIYDVPVVYFPKFSHPDPSVKRKSGFLSPSFINSSTHGLSLTVPYYMALTENKDLTFKPRFYADDKIILQNEYRQVNENNKHTLDFGINNSDFLNSKSQTKSHFFSNSFFDLSLSSFDTSNIELNIQRSSNDTYLKAYKITSPLTDSDTLLKSFLAFNASSEDISLTSSLEVWDDLSKSSADRYEFIYPNYKVLKTLNLDDSSLNLSSYGYQKKYETNKQEGIITNDLLYEANSKISKWGLKSSFNALLKNVNTDATNSTKYKDGADQSLFSSILFSSEYPLKKTNDRYNDEMTPKVSFMYSPNKTKNMTAEERRIDINNIYSFNRIGVSDTVEGGASMTLGLKYKKINKNDFGKYINLEFANVLRHKKNEDLSIVSTLGETQSDFFGDLEIKPNKNFDMSYNFALNNNLKQSNYDSIKTNFSLNNFATSFEYIDDKKSVGQKSYLANNTSIKIDDNGSVGFKLRRNNDTSATEFYDLYYSYANDCLEAAITYNKSYYSDSDLEPETQLFLSVTIIPFGTVNSPDITN